MRQRQTAAASRLLHRDEADVTAPVHHRPLTQIVVHLVAVVISIAHQLKNQIQPADRTTIEVIIRRQTEVQVETVDIVSREGLMVAEILAMETAAVLILKIRRKVATAVESKRKRNLQTEMKLLRLPMANRSG